MRFRTIVELLVLGALPPAGCAHPQKASSVEEAQQKSAVIKNRGVPLLSRPVTLVEFDGMKPQPEVERQMTKIDGFIQTSPTDGNAATQRTEVYLGRTNAALYVVFLCFDDHPTLVRSHLARRENILADDTVSVLLDPFQDMRRGVLFSLNPAGVQADAAWTDNQSISTQSTVTPTTDYSYDQVWDSDGRVTGKGWMALFAIPFRSLRFHHGAAGDMGVVLQRNLPRNSETDYWPHVAANVSGVLTQEGTLRGIEGVTESHNVQINPYLLAQDEKTLLSLEPLDPYLSSRHFEGTAGGEAKVIVKDSIVLDATVNPDFRDVESDQPQFTVNQRYPVYFPELRAFFLENANYFSTPIQLLYTRNIVRPEAGLRITGRIGSTNLGFLTIDDREPGHTVPQTDPAFGKHALFAVGRVSHDFGKKYTFGGIYTDEEFSRGWNRIGGFDFTARVTPNWTIQGQAVESSTKPGDPDSVAAVFPTRYAAGPASYVEVIRNGHAFNLDSYNYDYSSGFQSQVGFIQTTNLRADNTRVTYQWYPKRSILQSFGLGSREQFWFDHQGNRVYRYSNFYPYFNLPRQIQLQLVGGQESDTLGPQSDTLFTANHNFTQNFGAFQLQGSPLSQVSFNVQGYLGGGVNFNPPPRGLPSLANEKAVNALVTFQPLRQLTLDNTYLLDREITAKGGDFVYENQVFRTKINFQLTRAFSARVIAEYDSLLTNPLQTSLARTKQVATQALLTWLPHPGTAIYIGYNNDLQNLSRDVCTRLGTGECDANQTVLPRAPGYYNDGKQFFIKASYLLRF